MEYLYKLFCRHRANELYQAKQDKLILMIELEKRNLRVQQLLRACKEMNNAHRMLLAQHELRTTGIEQTLKKIDSDPPELLAKALALDGSATVH